jgi:hypothetical protein
LAKQKNRQMLCRLINLGFREAKILASARLAHAGNLTLPAGGTAPRNRGLLGGLGAATADESAGSQKQKREEAFGEGGHGSAE